jgi:hypothetical protein
MRGFGDRDNRVLFAGEKAFENQFSLPVSGLCVAPQRSNASRCAVFPRQGDANGLRMVSCYFINASTQPHIPPQWAAPEVHAVKVTIADIPLNLGIVRSGLESLHQFIDEGLGDVGGQAAVLFDERATLQDRLCVVERGQIGSLEEFSDGDLVSPQQ